MNKLRASYSLLYTWDKKRYEECALYYFRLKTFITPAMAGGTDYHAKWQEHIKLTNTLPKEFGGIPLVNPMTEYKIEVDIADWLTMVGVIDCYDQDTIYEFKTGVKDSSEYINSMQLPIYGLLCKLSDKPVRTGKLLHYNQIKNSSDQSMIWLTKKNSKEALNWIQKNASEMHQYFESEGLYDKYGNREPLIGGGSNV